MINIAENTTIKLRQADEAVEQAKESPDQQARLERERDLIKLQNQIDLARSMSFQLENQDVHEEFLETQAMLQLARKQLSVASEHVELSQQDVDQVQKKIDMESQHIIAELKQGVSALDFDNKAGQQLRPEPSITGEATQQLSAEPEQLDPLRQAQLYNADIKLQVLNRILVYLQTQRDIWNLRLIYDKVTDREKTGEAYARIARNQTILKAVHDYVIHQRHRVLTLVTKQSVEELDPTNSGSDALRDQLRNLNLDQVVLYSRLLGIIEATQNLLDRCKQDLDEKFRVKSFSDYLEEALLATRDVASQVWDFEIFAVQDNIEVDGQIISGKRSVTVDKVVTALGILDRWLLVCRSPGPVG